MREFSPLYEIKFQSAAVTPRWNICPLYWRPWMTSCCWTYMKNVTCPGIFICRSLYTCVCFYLLFIFPFVCKSDVILWSEETAIVTNDTWMLSSIESCSWRKNLYVCSNMYDLDVDRKLCLALIYTDFKMSEYLTVTELQQLVLSHDKSISISRDRYVYEWHHTGIQLIFKKNLFLGGNIKVSIADVFTL